MESLGSVESQNLDKSNKNVYNSRRNCITVRCDTQRKTVP